MKFLHWYTILFCCVSLPTISQTNPTESINGVVGNRDTQELLIGATTQVTDTASSAASPSGTITDAEGRFQLVLLMCSYTLRVTYVGYQPVEKFNIIVLSGNASENNFELEEANKQFGEGIVTANRTAAAVSSILIQTPSSA